MITVWLNVTKLIILTLNEVSTLIASSISAQPTTSRISGPVNNSSEDQVNDPDGVITNTEDKFITKTDVGPNHYHCATNSAGSVVSSIARKINHKIYVP